MEPVPGHRGKQHITHAQNNSFWANMYSGPWRFMAGEQGTTVSWSQWQGASFGQDFASMQWG